MKPDMTPRHGLRGALAALAARNDHSGAVAGSVVQANVIQDVTLVAAPAAAQVKRPRQLPPPPHAFVNRSDELCRIARAVTAGSGGAAIVVLTGLAGVGKTACAVEFGHRNADRFPDGQLFADLDGYRHGGTVAVTDVVAAFLRALGVPWDYLPPSFPERVAQFRSLTARRRLLVVLDGADHAAQVRALVPGSPGSAVIATSRRRLSGLAIDGAHAVALRPLDGEHGASMVARMLTDERAADDPASVRRLVDLCAGLPIALRVVGAELGRLDRWSVARYARHLSDDRQRLRRLSVEGDQHVEHVFDAAYGELPDPAQRLYRLLGLHPGPDFGPGAAAALADRPDEDAEALLGVLRGVNLVEEHAPDRYRFHDLVRLHARGVADRDCPPAEREEARRRVVAWYLLGAAAADHAVLGPARWRLARHPVADWPVAFDGASGKRWLEVERTNLLGAVRLAAELGDDGSAWRFCEALWALYHSLKHHADWIEAHRIGVAAAVRCGHRDAECRLRNQLARAHIELREFDAARAEIALAEGAVVGEGYGLAMVHESRGLLLRAGGHFAEAARAFGVALDVSRRLGDPRAIGIQGYQCGDALVHAVRPAEALPVLDEARGLLADLHDELATARVHIALGRAYEALHRTADARRVLDDAVAVTRHREQPVKEAQALEVLVVIALGEHDDGLLRTSAQRLYQLYREAGNPRSAEVLRWLDRRC
ncbi:ATP-binding protein [Actinosynnema sp. NPDC020468]|uniref:ATP-binding protein n=1 Tax=Actinosynnema sp. NPDC020468 TaxID=3154488 RepID=UPI0033FAB957